MIVASCARTRAPGGALVVFWPDADGDVHTEGASVGVVDHVQASEDLPAVERLADEIERPDRFILDTTSNGCRLRFSTRRSGNDLRSGEPRLLRGTPRSRQSRQKVRLSPCTTKVSLRVSWTRRPSPPCNDRGEEQRRGVWKRYDRLW